LRAAVDPKCERPELRKFNFCPLEETAKRRPELVIAALTILRAYHVAGRPKQPNLNPLGSFDEWSDWVRSALVWLGEPDPCLTMAAARDTDPELKQLRNLLGAWHELFPTAVTIKRAIEEARTYAGNNPDLQARRAALLEAMEAIAADRRGDINARVLGIWITRHKGRIVDGLCFEEDGVSHHTTLWKVVERKS